jgi:hypothetical protein
MGNNGSSSGDKLKGLSGCKQKVPKGEADCQQPPKHWVAVRLRYKDDKKFVWAADCVISQGATEINAGPLAAGTLESTNLDAGSYEVSFTNIHPDEWEPE